MKYESNNINNNLNNNININNKNDVNQFNNNNTISTNNNESLKFNQSADNSYKSSDNNTSLKIEKIKDYFRFSPLIGLENIGATCDMNATLQCFCHIEQFVDFFKYNHRLI